MDAKKPPEMRQQLQNRLNCIIHTKNAHLDDLFIQTMPVKYQHNKPINQITNALKMEGLHTAQKFTPDEQLFINSCIENASVSVGSRLLESHTMDRDADAEEIDLSRQEDGELHGTAAKPRQSPPRWVRKLQRMKLRERFYRKRYQRMIHQYNVLKSDYLDLQQRYNDLCGCQGQKCWQSVTVYKGTADSGAFAAKQACEGEFQRRIMQKLQGSGGHVQSVDMLGGTGGDRRPEDTTYLSAAPVSPLAVLPSHLANSKLQYVEGTSRMSSASDFVQVNADDDDIYTDRTSNGHTQQSAEKEPALEVPNAPLQRSHGRLRQTSNGAFSAEDFRAQADRVKAMIKEFSYSRSEAAIELINQQLSKLNTTQQPNSIFDQDIQIFDQ